MILSLNPSWPLPCVIHSGGAGHSGNQANLQVQLLFNMADESTTLPFKQISLRHEKWRTNHSLQSEMRVCLTIMTVRCH